MMPGLPFREHYTRRIEDSDPGIVCFRDFGPVVTNSEVDLINMDRSMDEDLGWLAENCRTGWRWTFEDRPLWKCEDGEMLLCPNPIRGATLIDMHRLLWISFDSKDDAMLARITLIGLQGEHHAFGGRMSRTTS